MAQKTKTKPKATTKPKKEKRSILHRVQKWPLTLTTEQEKLFYRISDGLREYNNLALGWQEANREVYKKALAKNPEQKDIKSFLNAFDLYTIYKDKQRPADDKNNLFRAQIPANWVFETFRQVEAAYKSFFELIKNYKDARTPREIPEWRFQVISGALSASFSLKDDMVQLVPRAFDGALRFSVEEHQAREMAKAIRFAKFTIARSTSDLRKKGKLTISVAYELEQPSTVEFIPEQAVFVSLGVNSLGVTSAKGDKVISILRPDTHWKKQADQLSERCDVLLGQNKLSKGSRKHRRQRGARVTVFSQMSKQQLLDRRSVVIRELLEWAKQTPMTKQERRFHRKRNRLPNDGKKTLTGGHGVHFVVTELTVRSKEGKLADADKPERGGRDGLNWGAQNTGTIAYLVSWLTEKVKEHGGSVRRLPLDEAGLPPEVVALAEGEQQIVIAQKLRDVFLTDPSKAQVL